MHLGLHYYRNPSVDRPAFCLVGAQTVSAVTSQSCPDASRRKQPSTGNGITQTDRIACASPKWRGKQICHLSVAGCPALITSAVLRHEVGLPPASSADCSGPALVPPRL